MPMGPFQTEYFDYVDIYVVNLLSALTLLGVQQEGPVKSSVLNCSQMFTLGTGLR